MILNEIKSRLISRLTSEVTYRNQQQSTPLYLLLFYSFLLSFLFEVYCFVEKLVLAVSSQLVLHISVSLEACLDFFISNAHRRLYFLCYYRISTWRREDKPSSTKITANHLNQLDRCVLNIKIILLVYTTQPIVHFFRWLHGLKKSYPNLCYAILQIAFRKKKGKKINCKLFPQFLLINSIKIVENVWLRYELHCLTYCKRNVLNFSKQVITIRNVPKFSLCCKDEISCVTYYKRTVFLLNFLNDCIQKNAPKFSWLPFRFTT